MRIIQVIVHVIYFEIIFHSCNKQELLITLALEFSHIIISWCEALQTHNRFVEINMSLAIVWFRVIFLQNVCSESCENKYDTIVEKTAANHDIKEGFFLTVVE